MMRSRRLCLMFATVLGVSALGALPAQANDIVPLDTQFGTDVAVFGLGGMRGLGAGSITVSGVSGSVTRALLFWHGPTDSSDPAANATVSFAASTVVGTNIGVSSDNCWGYTNSQAYRADVTSLVTGNGAFALANFTKSGVEINGVSLVVFFDDGNASNNRDFVMFDGNDSNTSNTYDADGWNVNLSGVNYASGSASLDLIVSDGQLFDDAALLINATTLVAGPLVFQGDSVPSAGSNNNGLLWDVKSYDITSSLTPGPNTLAFTTGYQSDCLSLVMAAVNLPAGSAPNQPTTTTTTASTTSTPQSSTTTTVRSSNTSTQAVVATPRFTG